MKVRIKYLQNQERNYIFGQVEVKKIRNKHFFWRRKGGGKGGFKIDKEKMAYDRKEKYPDVSLTGNSSTFSFKKQDALMRMH